jgi:hypothetical protein
MISADDMARGARRLFELAAERERPAPSIAVGGSVLLGSGASSAALDVSIAALTRYGVPPEKAVHSVTFTAGWPAERDAVSARHRGTGSRAPGNPIGGARQGATRSRPYSSVNGVCSTRAEPWSELDWASESYPRGFWRIQHPGPYRRARGVSLSCDRLGVCLQWLANDGPRQPAAPAARGTTGFEDAVAGGYRGAGGVLPDRLAPTDPVQRLCRLGVIPGTAPDQPRGYSCIRVGWLREDSLKGCVRLAESSF